MELNLGLKCFPQSNRTCRGVMTNQSSSQSPAWTVGKVKERLPEILHLEETEGRQRIVAERTFILATTGVNPLTPTYSAEPLEMDEAAKWTESLNT